MSSILSYILPQNFVRIPKSAFLLLTIAGFAILCVQIVGVRVLGAFLGTEIPVWATIIGVILTGGIIGYYSGGAIADTWRSKKVSYALALLTGLSIMIIPFTRALVPYFNDTISYNAALFMGAILLFLLPSLLLGAIITYVIRLYVTSLETIGQVHGDLYSIATIGSILGVFVTSYILIPTFSVPHILYGLGALVIISGILHTKQT